MVKGASLHRPSVSKADPTRTATDLIAGTLHQTCEQASLSPQAQGGRDVAVSDAVAAAIWMVLGGWLATGLAIALPLIWRGLSRLNPGGGAVPWRVRLLLLPGMAALWPIILLRLSGVRPPEDRG